MGAQAPDEDLTALLARWRTGTPDDRERLLAAVQADLRRIAGAYMRRERREHTLQPTALVNEAYLRLAGSRDEGRWEDRAHFFGIAARAHATDPGRPRPEAPRPQTRDGHAFRSVRIKARGSIECPGS
jgi:hypothetical protein